ncbi:MAG: tyrosine-protein phosphatase [Anaerolineae bacterium]|nr:tyrosine-protein phosphatase [Anaerolineae bacterium]
MSPHTLPVNFRDFGGARTTAGALVKVGLLYRSGAPAQPGTIPALQAIGIRTLIDLRSRQERRRALPAGHFLGTFGTVSMIS